MNFIKSNFKNILIGLLVVTTALFLVLFIASTNSKAEAIEDAQYFKKQSDDYFESTVSLNERIEKQEKKIEKLSSKVEDAEPWFKLEKEKQKKLDAEREKHEIAKEKERKAKEKQLREKKRQEEAQRKEKKRQEEAQRKAEERKGFDTGITYDQIARNPDKYEASKIKFTGTVIQVIEGVNIGGIEDGVQIRFAVNDDYNKIILLDYFPEDDEPRILENDKITIMGIATGVTTYEATSGASITVPSMIVYEVE